MRDLNDLLAHVQRHEQESSLRVADATHEAMYWNNMVTVTEKTVSVFEQLHGFVLRDLTNAIGSRRELEAAGTDPVTAWRTGIARETERRLQELLGHCDLQLSGARARHAAALRHQNDASDAVDAVAATAYSRLEDAYRTYVRGLEAAMADSANVEAELSKAELKAIRRYLREEEWSDLPEFHGSEIGRRRDCLHCGVTLPIGRKRFCSIDCHRMHLEAYGTSARPKRI